jgi:AraC family transcriptional regulator, transcriptional activator of pobA
MARNTDLGKFNVYQYLKEKHAHSMTVPYFLADQEVHKNSTASFPIRAFTYAIGLNYVNGGPFRIGSNEYAVGPGSLITIGPGIVCQWKGDYNTQHDTVYFTEELFKNTLKNSALKSLSFFLPGGNHVIHLSPEDVAQLKALFDVLRQFKSDEDVVAGIIHSMLMLVTRYHKLRGGNQVSSAAERIAGNFKSLLSKHFLQNKEVSFYAGQLHITPKYLSEVLVNETGKTTKALIDEHIFLEAKSLLRQTSMTVQEICHWLGYEDTSYFTKAFKKQENLTPLAYRKL